MSIQKLITSFTTSCWIPSCKTLISYMKTLDKKVANFQSYFNAKKYNSLNKVNYSDKDRYDALIIELIKNVKMEDTIKPFTVNFELWLDELEKCMKTEQIYNTLSVNFLKSSYGKMIDDFNRILLPKNTNEDENEDDAIDPLENLKKYTKNYSQDFDKIVNEYIENGYLLYKNVMTTTESDITPVLEQMLKQENQVFSIYSLNGTEQIMTLWISDKPLEFEKIEYGEFMSIFTDNGNTFVLNPEHQTNMDTIKRNYINKQKEMFISHVKMLIRNNALYFYKGDYLHCDDYKSYSELQFTNAVNSFPVNFEDYTKNAFALFYFNKTDEYVKINSYWITSKPINEILSTYDYGLFTWIEINYDEFLHSSDIHENYITSILH